MKKTGVVGHFAFGKNFLDGQTIKTKIVAEELDRVLGEKNVKKADTYGSGIKKIFCVLKAIRLTFVCDNIVLIVARNGIKVFAPVLSFFSAITGCKLHYPVIGGWISGHIENMEGVKKALKKFDGVYLETSLTKQELEEMGYKNAYMMANCKNLRILKEDELVYNTEKPYRLCTFSRVMKEKGMEDAINAVKAVNEKYGETVYTLDIYGQVDAGQTQWFEDLKKTFPDYVNYGGAVDFNKTTEVLKDYYALLFPTHYFTEGIPGTIIDAYAAGVPVVSAKWKHYKDTILENETGLCYEFDKYEDFEKTMFEVANNPKSLNDMKLKCLSEAEKFLPKNAMEVMVNKII